MATKTAAKAASTPAIERKALAEDNKSAGMRMLFDAGYTVTRVQSVFNAPYGYVYGVALRHGVIATAANRRVSAEPKAKRPVAKARPAKVTAAKATGRKTTAVAKVARATKASTASTTAAKAGRPSPARRQANRKARTATK